MSHYSLDGRLPQSMAEDVWLAPTAQVIGDVVLGREASIWFSAIVRGDNEPIVIGDRTNVQQQVIAMNASYYVRNATRFRKGLEHLHPDHPGTTARGVGNAGHPG
jgi:carbonic anhydrase/acetyltransferase-like protein (isoleucine patch superfamily)